MEDAIASLQHDVFLMKVFNRETGKFGEDKAAEFLENKGYKILKRNFGNKFGEIDIIAVETPKLGVCTYVFVEVKTKKGIDFGMPEEMINPRKLYKIRNMASVYLRGQTVACRIDVVAVVLSDSNEVLRLTHYENVY